MGTMKDDGCGLAGEKNQKPEILIFRMMYRSISGSVVICLKI